MSVTFKMFGRNLVSDDGRSPYLLDSLAERPQKIRSTDGSFYQRWTVDGTKNINRRRAGRE